MIDVLHIWQLRVLEDIRITLHPETNLIVGPNAAGKTSVLEAVYVLARGRSFRAKEVQQLIKRGADRYRIVAQVHQSLAGKQTIGLERTGTMRRLRLGGRDATVADITRVLPIQLFSPHSVRLLEDGPAGRRRYLDWGVFHVEHGYLGYWRRYQQALKQRNAALRGGAPQQAWAWEEQMTAAGEAVHSYRKRYFELLLPWIEKFLRDFLPDNDIECRYEAGWDTDRSLAQALESHRSRDARHHHTQVGPHRADLKVLFDGARVDECASRGQLKLLAVALLAAQVHAQRAGGGFLPVLLFDDMAAELDRRRRDALLEHMRSLGAQLVITSLSAQSFTELGTHRVFHVERGQVKEVL